MKRFLMRYTPVLTLLCICAGFLLQTSQSVQNARYTLKKIKIELSQTQQELDVLQAEWAYLNSPYRLEDLATKYLNLSSPQSANLSVTSDRGYNYTPVSPDVMTSIVYKKAIKPISKPRESL